MPARTPTLKQIERRMAQIETAWNGLLEYFEPSRDSRIPKDYYLRVAYERGGEELLRKHLIDREQGRSKTESTLFRVLHQVGDESDFAASVCAALLEYQLLAKLRDSLYERRAARYLRQYVR